MPSQRKRIGFLPREEVQIIIDEICKHNKLSQSKVTGILVDEALSFRGFLDKSMNYNTDNINFKKDKLSLNSSNSFNVKKYNDNNKNNLDESYVKNEVQMINDFIEYKFFKNIMNKNTHLKI